MPTLKTLEYEKNVIGIGCPLYETNKYLVVENREQTILDEKKIAKVNNIDTQKHKINLCD